MALFVDLTQTPYAVLADTASAAAANSAAIQTAISDHSGMSGMNARLVLPQGKIYLDRQAASPAYCIKFGTGVTDLTLAGAGQYATMLVQTGTSNAGEWDCIIIDGAQRIEICDLGIMQGTIKLPDPGQQNHLISVYNNAGGGTTRHIDVHDVYFATAIGDQFRLVAATSPDVVQDVTLCDFVMEGAGSVVQAWTPSTVYALWERVTNDNGKQYICVTAGKSGNSSGPTGTNAFTYSSTPITSVSVATEQLTTAAPHTLLTGDGPIRVSAGGGDIKPPAPLQSTVDYWVIFIDATNFKLATSAVNAMAGMAVDLKTTGSNVSVTGTAATEHVITTDGSVKWVYDNPRTGARSGVAVQRGYSRVRISRGFIRGVQNSQIDCEPTGNNTMEYLTIEDVICDNTASHTSSAVSLGGSHLAQAKHTRVRNLTVLGGKTNCTYNDDLTLENLVAVASVPFPADTGVAMLEIRNKNPDLRIINPRIERIGTCASGNCIDLNGGSTGGANITIERGTVLQGVAGEPCEIVDPGSHCAIRGLNIQYTDASPSTHYGVKVSALTTNVDHLQIDDIHVSTSTGKLRSAVWLAQRGGQSMSNVRVTNVHAAGYVSTGVYMTVQVPLTGFDPSPFITSINTGTANPAWTQTDINDNPTAALVPIVAGNRGSSSAPQDELGSSDRFNYVRNAGFWFAQRQAPGTATTYSNTSGRAISADGWGITNENASAQYARTDTQNAPQTGLQGRFYGSFTKISSTGKLVASQVIEGTDTNALRGRTVRVQCRMKGIVAAMQTVRLGLVQLNSFGTIDALPATFISAFGANGTDPTLGTNLAYILPKDSNADNATISGNAASCAVTTAWQRYGALFDVPSNARTSSSWCGVMRSLRRRTALRSPQ
jgi:hypothetical protein